MYTYMYMYKSSKLQQHSLWNKKYTKCEFKKM